jgi:metal-dependent amidase/aminoacylase/carboxypeptidase family protein
MPTVKVTATGIAAHAGNHHAEGANAIWALSRFITRVSAMNEAVRFTKIEGGQSRNTVPDHAMVMMSCPDDVLSDLDVSSDVQGTTLAIER